MTVYIVRTIKNKNILNVFESKESARNYSIRFKESYTKLFPTDEVPETAISEHHVFSKLLFA